MTVGFMVVTQRRAMAYGIVTQIYKALRGAISEIVCAAHYDSGFHGRDTAVFYGTLYHCTRPCHTDPFGEAQGMLREASRRMAL